MSARTPHPTRGARRRPARRRAAVATVGLPLALLLAAPPAVAADSGDVVVTNTETVQARLDADGRLQVARVYDQLAFSGSGTVTVTNPVSTQGLRNLDGFGGYTVEDDAMRTTVTVDGRKRLRTVSDFTGELPVSVAVEYRLDGEKVPASGVVGRSGLLEVRYTVTNLTSRQDEVTYDDGTGGRASRTVETVIPFVGQLTTTLPPSFTAVASDEASMAGDGRGGTRMSYTMTLFPPIGSTVAEFGYTARITQGRVPPANVSVLPVSPLTSPSFKGGSASYQGGAASGIALTEGATEIDANLLRLRDGAAELLDGLLQLQAGADQLAAGLNDTALPGATQLAAGAADLDDGAGDLAAGARTLDGGAGDLVAGARSLDEGADRLVEGAARLDAGLASAGEKVPQLLAGLTDVGEGLDTVDRGLAKLYAQIGTVPAQAQPLHDGVTELQRGVNDLLAGLTALQGLQTQLASVHEALGTTAATVSAATDPVPMGALSQLFGGLAQQATDPVQKAQFQGLASLYAPTAYAAAPTTPVPLSHAFTALGGVTRSVAGNLQTVRCGLTKEAATTCDDEANGLREGLTLVAGGIDVLTDGVVSSVRAVVGVEGQAAEDETLRGGIASLTAGVGQLSTGGQQLVGGLGELSAGASTLRSGSSTLADGADRLAAGSSTLADGAGRLAAGSSTLAAGTGRLTDGADRLADGLRTAADGSLTLAEGLGAAADGAPALVDGAQQLSDEGTSVLVGTGAATAADYGVKYAVIEAGAQRAATEAMAYGGPEGAAAVTAYSIDIAAADGSGASALGRGIAATALFGLGGVLTEVARRRFA